VIKCFSNYPQCWASSFENIEICLAFGAPPGSLIGNCSCLNPGQAPASINTCLSDLYCPSSTNVCTVKETSGTCLFGTECGDSTYHPLTPGSYSCINSQCVVTPNTQAANDGCTSSNNCVDGIPCTGGVCIGSLTGAVCTSDFSCAYNYYCNPNSGTCAPAQPLGTPCTASDQCLDDSICGYASLTLGKCVPIFSVPAGNPCFSTDECQYGLYCDGACTPVPTSYQPCKNNTDCSKIIGSVCACNLDGTRTCDIGPLNANVGACNTQYETLENCVKQFGCKDVIGANTCGANHCENQLSCYLKCINSNYPTTPLMTCNPPLTNLVCVAPANIISFIGLLSFILIMISIM